MDSKPSVYPQTPSTGVSTIRDNLSTVSNSVAKSEDMQMNIALQNSLKDSFPKSSFSPDGVHISELRAKRRLFHETDKQMLSDAKRPAFEQEIHYDFSKDSSPQAYASSSKAMSRINNNNLDSAYFMSTQYDDETGTSPGQVATMPPLPNTNRTKTDSSQWGKLRVECIRRMRVKDANTNNARKLYRVLNRKHPKDLFSDIESMASDCHASGMTVEDTVDCMIDMIE